MIRINRLFLLIMCCGYIGACSTMSKQTCEKGDWRQIGYSAGLRGDAQESYQAYVDACKSHGLLINAREQFIQVWRSGNKAYCKPVNGFSVGAKGFSYQGACSAQQETEFLNAYFKGRNSYLINSKFDEINHRISALNNKLYHIEQLQKEQQLTYRRYDKAIAELNKALAKQVKK